MISATLARITPSAALTQAVPPSWFVQQAQRSGPAAGRVADRPLQPIVRPPSLTHIAQVCGSWTIKNLVNAKLRLGLA